MNLNLDKIEQNIMGELKDFQRATVCRIDELYRKGQNRVLVSDEVGLGKTLVAKGTIAKFAKLRQEEGDNLVKVVYLCSNSTIAEQNLEKLRITDEIKTESTDTSRLSMQHLNIFMQENNENYLNNIQLIPLTPKTSFNISNSQGKKEERALMFVILLTISDLKPYREKLSNLLSFDVNDWKGLVKDYIKKVKECNIKSNREYLKYMSKKVNEYLECRIYNGKPLMECLIDFCKNQQKYSSKKIKDLIVQLRIMFSDISIDRLDPDLIIMDEFQRFKDLLNGPNDDINQLSSKFFSLEDVRILMLSATPYKMFSTLDEIDEEGLDAHYSEFFRVMNFLNNDDKQQDIFRKIWSNYSIELKEFNKDKSSFILAKNRAENALFKNICRTERIAETNVSNLMEDVEVNLEVSKNDISSYIEAQKLTSDLNLNISVPIDYIKSTPYIMSFMEDYNLKEMIFNHIKESPEEIYKMNKKIFWLNKDDINNYEEISFNNARLNDLMNRVLVEDCEKLLWIPPSKPYYEPSGVFKNKEGFSKTLIFSSWVMVPKMISSLVSYEVERKTIGKLDKIEHDIRYFTENRYPSKRLDFSFNNEKPNKMTLFTLLYPSRFLVNLYNPIDCLNRNLSCEEIESEVKDKLKNALPETPKGLSDNGDSRWYYLAPLMLDHIYPNYIENWFKEMAVFLTENYSKNKNFSEYVKFFEKYYSFFKGNIFKNLGKQPTDLWDVLCDMVIASPAICAYRCYRNYEYSNSNDSIAKLSTIFANIFRKRMNQPESISVIDLIFKGNSEDAYWKNVLKYSKQGNLQAVFDEYVHILSCNIDKNNENRISIINNKIVDSFDFRTTHYNFDIFGDFSARINDDKEDYSKLRSHFAVSFIKGDDESAIRRRKSVRDAFNSPFRPFVLTSTSIGQEGLDFHNYCRRIVHWNLPSNPLELEQREGRINRFKCLAIRQNVAKRYGHINFKSNDIWKELFNKASNVEKINGCSDLIPYWGLKDYPDMIKIERIVPMYPFSRDVTRYDRLMKVLSLYRLTLGQSRQEELLSQIYQGIDDFDNIKELFINLSPFYKKEIGNNEN